MVKRMKGKRRYDPDNEDEGGKRGTRIRDGDKGEKD